MKCNLCKSTEFKTISNYKYSDKIFKNLKLYLCKNCEVYFSYPLIKDEKLNIYYNNTPNTSIGEPNSGRTNLAFAHMLAKKRTLYILNNSTLPKDKKIKILEIGPGYGHLSSSIKSEFIIENYSAIESDLKCHHTLNKLDINIYKDLNEIPKNSKYDLIVLSHILEHVQDPTNFFKNLNIYLNDKGIIFVDIPCEDWRYKSIFEPHLFFYNKKSLYGLFNILNLKILSIDYFGDEIKNIKNDNPFFFKKLFKRLFKYIQYIYYSIYLFNFGSPVLEFIANKNFKADKNNINKSRWIRLIVEK